MWFFSVSVAFFLPSAVAYLFHAASLHTSSNVGAITKKSCTGDLDIRMLLRLLPTQTPYHCIVVCSYTHTTIGKIRVIQSLCLLILLEVAAHTNDLPSSSLLNGYIMDAREGMHMVGWCIFVHLDQLGQFQALLKVDYSPYRLPIPQQPKVHST
jgi:hypothetical protein